MKDRLPIFDRGLLGELLYGDQPRIIDQLEVPPDDPAAEYFARPSQSLMAIPMFDGGTAINMVIADAGSASMRQFSTTSFPEWV